MMQVVEGYVRDQTILLVYMTYIQENMMVDIQSAKHSIINNVIVREVRETVNEILLQRSQPSRPSRSSKNLKASHRYHQEGLLTDLEVIQEHKILLENIRDDLIDNEIKEQIVQNHKEKKQEQNILISFEDFAITSLFDQLLTELATKEVQREQQLELDCQQVYDRMIQNQFEEEITLICVQDLVETKISLELMEKGLEFVVKLERDSENLKEDIMEVVVEQEINKVAEGEILSRECSNQFLERVIRDSLSNIVEDVRLDLQIQDMLIQEYYTDLLTSFIHSSLSSFLNHSSTFSQALSQVHTSTYDLCIHRETLKVINETLGYIHTTNQHAYDIAFHLLADCTHKFIQEEIVPQCMEETKTQQNLYEHLIKSEVRQICEQVFEDKLSQLAVERSEREIEEELIDEGIQKQQQEEEMAEKLFNMLLSKILVGDLEEIEDKQEQGDEQESVNIVVTNQHQEDLIDKISDEIIIQCICGVIIESINEFTPEENFNEIDEQKDLTQQSLNIYSQSVIQNFTEGLFDSVISHHSSYQEKIKSIEQQYTELQIEQTGLRLIKNVVQEQVLSLVKGIEHKYYCESMYKRIFNRILKRSLYAVIQQSVDQIYSMEEDTISLANSLLDSFIRKQLRESSAYQVEALRISGKNVDQIMNTTLRVEIRKIIYETIREQNEQFTKVQQPLQTQSDNIYISSDDNFHISQDDQCLKGKFISPSNINHLKTKNQFTFKMATSAQHSATRTALFSPPQYPHVSSFQLEKLAQRFINLKKQEIVDKDYHTPAFHQTQDIGYQQTVRGQELQQDIMETEQMYDFGETINQTQSRKGDGQMTIYSTIRSSQRSRQRGEKKQNKNKSNSRYKAVRNQKINKENDFMEETDDQCTVNSDDDEFIAFAKYTKNVETVASHQPKAGIQYVEQQVNDQKYKFLESIKSPSYETYSRDKMREKKTYKERSGNIKQVYQGIRNHKKSQDMQRNSPQLILKQNPSFPTKQQHQQESINSQVEKILKNLGRNYKEIQSSNPKSPQLKYISNLYQITCQILNNDDNEELSFEVDMKLKDILSQISQDRKHHQECFNIILYTNKLALLNYHKISTIVDTKHSAKPLYQSSSHSQISSDIQVQQPKTSQKGMNSIKDLQKRIKNTKYKYATKNY